MVFSSVPLYLDPPNWQQHPNQQQLQGGGPGNENQHLIPPPTVPQQPLHMGGPGGGGGALPIRPNSMAERARLAKIPPPEAPLKCPRCDSTNTKFCYFNNYSLSQPRHFCKTCRRYWTRGGALRNVPVGGGCRRNKRSSSKSSGGGGGSSTSSKSSLSSPNSAVGGGQMDIVGTTGIIPPIAGMPTGGGGGMTSFMASLQNMAQLGMGNLGLTFGGSVHAPSHQQAMGGLSGGDHHPQLEFNVSSLLNHHAPQVQFPSALGGGGFELSATGGGNNLYSSSNTFQTSTDDHHHHHHHHHETVNDNNNLHKSCSSTVTMMSQLAPVKMEGEGQRLNLAKQLMMGISSSTSENNHFWGGEIVGNTTASMWTDLSGLNSSSTTHLL